MKRSDSWTLGFLFIFTLIIHVSMLVPHTSMVDTPSASGFSVAQNEFDYNHCFPILISRFEDFVGLGFAGSGTQENPFIIEDLNVTVLTGNCITVDSVSEHFVIRNCFLKSASYFYACIELNGVDNARIENCIIEGVGYGIETYNSNGTVIKNCVVYGASHGVHLGYSREIEVSECRILANGYGIQIDGSNDCNISSNLIYRNSNAGIYVDYTAGGNLFSRNKIGWNGPSYWSGMNAYDNGIDNVWETNEWSDYVSPGLYLIQGDAASSDTSPQLLQDTADPVIETQDDLYFSEGTKGMEIQWSTSDEFPASYELTFSNRYTIANTWVYQRITCSLDNLPPGDHQFTLRVYDGSNRQSSDSVFVTVFVVMFSEIGSPILTYASIGSTVALISVLVLFKLKQRK